MQAIGSEIKIRIVLVSLVLILLGGVLGFFIGGTFAANLVAGENALADATTVALSAIGTGILGTIIGFAISTRFKV